MSFVEVLPVDPVMPTTRADVRSRTAPEDEERVREGDAQHRRANVRDGLQRRVRPIKRGRRAQVRFEAFAVFELLNHRRSRGATVLQPAFKVIFSSLFVEALFFGYAGLFFLFFGLCSSASIMI